VSSCRLVQGAKASAGKRDGTSGTKSGNASLTWAFAAAAGLFLRNTPAGQKYLARFEKQHGKGQAVTILAHTLARAVSYLGKRRVVCALDTFLQHEGRGADEPVASLGPDGRSLATVRCHEASLASTNAPEPRGILPCPCAFAGTPALAPVERATVLDGDRVRPLPRT
jgi:hypothetical protein